MDTTGISGGGIPRLNSDPKPRIEERVESFFQVVPISDLMCACRPGRPNNDLEEKLRSCGLSLTRSNFSILDQSRIGSCTITIVRYILEYVECGDATGRMTSVDGSVAIRIDDAGNRYLWLSMKTDPFGAHEESSCS